MQSDKGLTGFPSIDKPWLKYYSNEALSEKIPECTIYEYLFLRNKDNLDGIAIQYLGRKITYREVFKRIDETASALLGFGVAAGDAVAICLPSIPEAVYIIYALNKIGAIPNMLDPRYNDSLLAFCLNETKHSLLITIDVCYHKFTDINANLDVVIVSGLTSAPSIIKLFSSLKAPKEKVHCANHIYWDKFLKGKSSNFSSLVKQSANSCAVILHTGGTTGDPKGVLLSNYAINSIAHQYKMIIQPKKGRKLLDIIPPFAAYGFCASIHMPLSFGLTVEMIPKFNATEFDKLLHLHKPNYVMGVPSFYENLLNSKILKNEDMSYLLSAACGGDCMSTVAEERINEFLKGHNSCAHIDMGYGMTEMSATACVCFGKMHCNGSVGAPFSHTIIKIINPQTGKECKYNCVGEICISGPGMMIGYLGNEELTAKTIRTHRDGCKWVHTGDLGHINEDGFLFHDGRIKRFIVRYDGFKIYPAAVERVIMEHTNVENCLVVGYNNTHLGTMPIAYITLKRNSENHDKITSELLEMCKGALAERAIPDRFLVVDYLPLTPSGKVDYRALEADANNIRQAP